MSKTQTIKVKALTYHSFGTSTFAPGDTYEVAGDGTQTAEQYAETLRLLGFAALHTEDDDKKSKKTKDEGEYETREMKAKR